MAESGMAMIPFDRILITGADGFVGRYLVPALATRLGTSSRLTLASRTFVPDGDYDHVMLDLIDPDSVGRAIEMVRPDLVIHLAAQASVGLSLGAAADTWSVNLGGSLILAKMVAAAVPECTMLQVSSAEVYGLTYNDGIVDEVSVLRPQSAYARSKAATEAMLADVLPTGFRLIVARPSNHSGPGQDERFVIPAFAAQIARMEKGEAKEVQIGNLDAERDFLDVRDVVAAYVALAIQAPRLPLRSTFNIASGHTVRVGEVLERLQAMSRVDIPVKQDAARLRPSEVPCAAIDSSLIRDTTGWFPVHGLDETLGNVLNQWRSLR